MATTATITVSVNIVNATGVSKTLSYPIVTAAAAVGSPQTFNLATGNSTVTPPAGTTHVIALIPAQTGIITIKGVGADAGFASLNNNTTPDVLVLPLSGPSFVVNATVAVNGIEVWFI